jgi:hypothetical protein
MTEDGGQRSEKSIDDVVLDNLSMSQRMRRQEWLMHRIAFILQQRLQRPLIDRLVRLLREGGHLPPEPPAADSEQKSHVRPCDPSQTAARSL